MSDKYLDASKPKPQSKDEHEPLQSSKNSAQDIKIPITEIDDQGRSYVAAYAAPNNFPFELNEQVYIYKPSFRSPMGPFIITQLLPNDRYQLSDAATRVVHRDIIQGKDLTRDPFVP